MGTTHKRHKIQKTGMTRDKTASKGTATPKSPRYSPAYGIPDRFAQQLKLGKEWNEKMECLNDRYNLDYYSSSESDFELEHKYETLI